ncbi:MAG: nucleotide kinase domain-containing protein, partial [Caulobacterales bacterium]
QGREFSRLGLDFKGLYGRPLQPIDCQNLFCEISKYARVAYPAHAGVLGRTRIKQNFVQKLEPVPVPMFPPHWKMNRVERKRLRR